MDANLRRQLNASASFSKIKHNSNVHVPWCDVACCVLVALLAAANDDSNEQITNITIVEIFGNFHTTYKSTDTVLVSE